MSLVDSFSFGGISRTLCVRLTAISSSDSSGLPGTSAGPESPPFSAASRESSRKPPSALSGPWQTHAARGEKRPDSLEEKAVRVARRRVGNVGR